MNNIMQTMRNAHDHAMKLLQDKCIAEAKDLLPQCQDCALQIGVQSKMRREGVQAVSYLENYCEQL